ncbi:hypothetical protein BV25DRAFT_269301 [Artomyces pyxidatus]|uniref:Uncharacterized protein n=1 Tax=Artomyces pyxidatus TaxID=48021 RepID=A0ACB8T7W8_9AGAM|nr:hypothetical protein BV25DRAFT_269301 [Artomyces pyxidatus]
MFNFKMIPPLRQEEDAGVVTQSAPTPTPRLNAPDGCRLFPVVEELMPCRERAEREQPRSVDDGEGFSRRRDIRGAEANGCGRGHFSFGLRNSAPVRVFPGNSSPPLRCPLLQLANLSTHRPSRFYPAFTVFYRPPPAAPFISLATTSRAVDGVAVNRDLMNPQTFFQSPSRPELPYYTSFFPICRGCGYRRVNSNQLGDAALVNSDWVVVVALHNSMAFLSLVGR